MNKLIIFLLVLSCCFISCSKDNPEEEEIPQNSGGSTDNGNSNNGGNNSKPIDIEKYIKLTSSHSLMIERGYVTGSATVYVKNESNEAIKDVSLTLKTSGGSNSTIGSWSEVKKGGSESVSITLNKHYYPDVILEYKYNGKKHTKEYNYR